jgi:hypothetical protein
MNNHAVEAPLNPLLLLELFMLVPCTKFHYSIILEMDEHNLPIINSFRALCKEHVKNKFPDV